MAVTGPDFIALQVRDLNASAHFYETQLGLRRVPAGPEGAVVFATKPIPFAVREPLPGVDLDAAEHPGLGVALWLHCDAAAELHETLSAAKVPVLRAPEPGPFGLTFAFSDPDGYVITVHDGD
ncbi:VOC family protein [Actinomycetaceae bacterium L2_0104]